ncbi:MAG TPA: DUF4383 domain-containing protein [Candidatus Paceibacterota bacterium]|nr:DUF4383 domain-containing protein [Candidatus Paceibacterota bacterium]
MARTVAYVFGAILTVVGLWGFLQNPVLGIFPANSLHSVVHLGTGLILLAIGVWWSDIGRLVFKIFGIVYVLLAIAGFVMGGDMVFGLIDNNLPDQILHLALGAVFLWAGFMANRSALASPVAGEIV